MSKILIIDDDDALRGVIGRALRIEGYVVFEANNGRMGISLTRQHQPDLVLSDVNMEELDGLDVLENLRSHADTSTIPLILMTGREGSDKLRLGMELGADDYLPKPFDSTTLVAAVRGRLERQRTLESYAAEKETRLLEILSATQDLVAMADTLTGHLLYLNRAGRKMLAIEEDEDISLLRLEDFHPDDQLGIQQARWIAEAVRCGVWVGESAFLSRDGRKVLVSQQILAHRTTADAGAYLSVVARDITDRKQMEQELFQERELLRALMDHLPDYLYFKDLESRFTRINAAQARILGLKTTDDAVGKSDADFFSSSFARQTLADEKRLFATGEPVLDNVEEIRTTAGNPAWVSVTKVPIRDRDGRITGLVGASRDITARRAAEQRLDKINQCLLSFGEDITQNIQQLASLARELLHARCSVYWRLDGGTFNAPVHCQAPHPEMIARPLSSPGLRAFFSLPEKSPFTIRDLAATLPAQELKKIGLGDFQTWAGVRVCVGNVPIGCLSLYFHSAFNFTPDDERVLGIIGSAIRVEEERWRAQSERQGIETQLRQAQKLEAIGQLAAGIAHEINTPTQYVGDNTRFLKDSFTTLIAALQDYEQLLKAAKAGTMTPQLIAKLEASLADNDLEYLFQQVPAAITESLEGVERVGKIVRAMKEFSHPGGKEKSPADINKAIESTVTVARNEWKYVAEVELDLQPQLPLVPCFVGEFNQSVLNLVINAAHAIGDVVKQKPDLKGKITIATRRKGDQVEVRVTDTGTGIPEAVRSRIFEPFFTTKEVGKGSGQGLPIVYTNIVKKHGGAVAFETELGRGTTFILRLPLTAANGGV